MFKKLSEKYRFWSVRTITGTDKIPQLSLTKELKKLGLKKGEKVIVGVVDGRIEIIRSDAYD